VSFELAPYEPEHRADYLRLLDDAWGTRALAPAEFDWWFDGNPAGSLRSVALADGKVVGVAGHSLLRMRLAGEDALATFSVHATTDPRYRGRGIFVELERRHERLAAEQGARVVLAFASAPTAPLFLGPLGWSEVSKIRVWGRPVAGRGRAGGRRAVQTAGDAAADWPNHVIRDGPHLAWRYAESPRGYELRDERDGYVVVGTKELRGRRVGYVADLVAEPGGARALVRRAIQAARGVALLAVPAPEHRAAYLSLGFMPIPWTLNFMGKALDGRPLDPDPRGWRFTLGDTDFF
jgi:GNAT superfamily N-acetyltransferase